MNFGRTPTFQWRMTVAMGSGARGGEFGEGDSPGKPIHGSTAVKNLLHTNTTIAKTHTTSVFFWFHLYWYHGNLNPNA
jgi:hypothetical protein